MPSRGWIERWSHGTRHLRRKIAELHAKVEVEPPRSPRTVPGTTLELNMLGETRVVATERVASIPVAPRLEMRPV